MTRDHFSDTGWQADAIKRRLVQWLLRGGYGFRPSLDAIGNEVLFSANWRRADLLILSDDFHALEIKGPADSLSLLADQLVDYHRVFDKVSVVTASIHLKNVRRIAPRKTGIICCDEDEPSEVRRPTRTSRLDKLDLCKFLSRNELASLLGGGMAGRSTDELRTKLADQNTTKYIRHVAHASVRKRYLPLFRSFLQDVGDSEFAVDDLRGLCGAIGAIRL